MNSLVRPVFGASKRRKNIIRVLENNVRQIENPNFPHHGEQMKNIVNVVIDTVPHVISRTYATRDLAIFSGKKREGAEFFPKDSIVDMNQNNFITKRFEPSQNFLVPGLRP